MSRIELHGVTRRYAGPVPVDAIRGIDLTVDSGEFVAIEGPSGGGKSTLLNIIGLLDAPDHGEYLLDGVDTAGASGRSRANWRSEKFAFIFQSFHLLDRRPVVDSVELGLMYRGLPPSVRRTRALSALKEVGLESTAFQIANTLSGGQRQRAAIARAIASGAPIVVADEPTGNLDSANAATVVEALRHLHQTGTTVVLVTHSPDVASAAARRICILDGAAQEIPNDSSPGHMASDSPHRANPVVPGRPSVVRPGDVLADALASLRSRITRTVSLIAAVALGVGLATATIGISQTASAQVSDTFDAYLNRDVMVTWYSDNDLSGQSPARMESIAQRLSEVSGVDAAAVVSELTTSVTQVNPTRPMYAPPVFSVVGDFETAGRLTVDWARNHGENLLADEILMGDLLATQLELGPLDARPTIELNGKVVSVVGKILSSPRDPSITGSIISSEETLRDQSTATTRAFLLTQSGAAQQVSRQAALVIDPYGPNQLEVSSPPDPRQLRGDIESGVALTLAIVTGIALLGAVGALTNAMMFAVNERRSELGLRRALGALPRHVVALIVTESATVGLVGGALGLCFGLGAVLIVTIAQHWIPVFDLALAPIAVGAGAVVGALGGILASAKASRIQPADALRA